MKTRWGEALDKNSVLAEYPRPQMVRDSCINLNGEWKYAITKDDDMPTIFDGVILVPFSPECELSGVNRTLMPNETLWYRKSISLPQGFNAGRVLLHFGAVDQSAEVYVNGAHIGGHVGGYTPFSFDITGSLDSAAPEKLEIVVRVHDLSDTSYHSRGKQRMARGGIWYTPQSGIWQTVWLESMPEKYISGIRLTPDYDNARLLVTVFSGTDAECKIVTQFGEAHFLANREFALDVSGFTPWTPETPTLYDATLTLESDSVKTYFGMRKFSVDIDKDGVKRLFLNNAPYYHNGLLDQGYWCDGLYTVPSDEAMIYDIATMKKLGFNMLRKHIKIEPLRWYYHCDRLGMLVWQDMMNGGGDYSKMTVTMPLVTGAHADDHAYSRFARTDEAGRKQYYVELEEMVRHLYNCVSIAMWVPFNEGWGQFDAKQAVSLIESIDTTRTIDHASGWHDQGIGELKSLHVYFKKYKFRPDKLGRAVILSEFGGYNRRIDGHCFNEKDYGYKKFTSDKELLDAYRHLYMDEILPAKRKGLAASVYTQVSDVEDELNGLLTYDRKAVKLPVDEVAGINAAVMGE